MRQWLCTIRVIYTRWAHTNRWLPTDLRSTPVAHSSIIIITIITRFSTTTSNNKHRASLRLLLSQLVPWIRRRHRRRDSQVYRRKKNHTYVSPNHQDGRIGRRSEISIRSIAHPACRHDDPMANVQADLSTSSSGSFSSGSLCTMQWNAQHFRPLHQQSKTQQQQQEKPNRHGSNKTQTTSIRRWRTPWPPGCEPSQPS